jgi:hypothetical protein
MNYVFSSEDNQSSLRKIQEAIMRGIRNGLDKVYLVAPNKEMAKSVSGKIEWLASFGGLLRLDAISLGIYPEQQKSAIITPSQKRRESRIEKISNNKWRFGTIVISLINKDCRCKIVLR